MSPSLSCSQMCRAPSSLTQVSCSNHSYCGFMSETVMSCLEDSVTQHFSPFSGSYIPSVPSNDCSLRHMELWVGDVDINVPVRAEYSTVNYSQSSDQLIVSELTTAYDKKRIFSDQG